jgi:hypothetical protein
MVSDEAKQTIDALSEQELREEIARKNRSRFQGDKYAYLQTRLASLEQQKQNEHRHEDVAHRNEELSLARDANKLSKIAIGVSIVAALIALGALFSGLWSK